MDALLCNYRRYQGRAKSLSRSSGSVSLKRGGGGRGARSGMRAKLREDIRAAAALPPPDKIRVRATWWWCACVCGCRNFTCAPVYIRIRAGAEKDIIGEGHCAQDSNLQGCANQTRATRNKFYLYSIYVGTILKKKKNKFFTKITRHRWLVYYNYLVRQSFAFPRYVEDKRSCDE